MYRDPPPECGARSSRRSPRWARRRAVVASLTAALVVQMVSAVPTVATVRAQADTAPEPVRTLTNSEFAERGEWTTYGGGAFDPLVSAREGSGSIQLPVKGAGVRSQTVSVTAGTLFLVRAKVRQDTWPRGNVTISIQQVNAKGKWIANLPSETMIAPFVNGQFSASGLYFTVPDDVAYLQVVLVRSNDQASADPMWVDEVTLESSPSIQLAPTPKAAFDGTQTRISSVGNWEVRGSSGTWEPWFPMCAAIDPKRQSVARYSSLAAQGINCDIWNGESVDALARAKAAGLRSFYQLAQYTNDKGWAIGKLDTLRQDIQRVNASAAADYLAGFYLDNENSADDVVRTRQVIETVRAVDVDGGKRRRPILELQGNYGSLGMWADEVGRPFSDAVGAYVPAVNSGGAGSAPGGQVFLQTQPGQIEPSAYCQINDGVGIRFRAVIYGCFAHGSRAMSFWGDGPQDPAYPETPQLEQQPWWPDLPAITKEMRELSPVLRAPADVSWTVSLSGINDLVPVTYGTRTVSGIAHLILANTSSNAQARTITVTGLPYAANEVRDFFTNALVATIRPDGTFDVVMPAAGIGSGSMVLRLVPQGWTPPPTTILAVKTTVAASPTTSAKISKSAKASPTVSTSKTSQATKTATGSTKTAPAKSASTATRSVAAPAAKRFPTATMVAQVSPEPLCRGGLRLESESATIPIGTAPVTLSGKARAWTQEGAPSALNWTAAVFGRVQLRMRYARAAAGPALRTAFASPSQGHWVARQFELPSTGGNWATATVDLDVPGPGPVTFSASFDVLTDHGTLDQVDSIDICPLG